MLKRILFLGLMIALIFSCTLSSEQEMSLNKDIHQFIQVRNEGDALAFLNYMHPAIVRHYKDLGDTTLNKKLMTLPKHQSSNDPQTDVVYWDHGYIKNVVKKDSLIKAKIEISLTKNYKSIDSTTCFYAISTSNASNWLFASENDYVHILE